jgi:hypothetical protein
MNWHEGDAWEHDTLAINGKTGVTKPQSTAEILMPVLLFRSADK